MPQNVSSCSIPFKFFFPVTGNRQGRQHQKRPFDIPLFPSDMKMKEKCNTLEHTMKPLVTLTITAASMLICSSSRCKLCSTLINSLLQTVSSSISSVSSLASEHDTHCIANSGADRKQGMVWTIWYHMDVWYGMDIWHGTDHMVWYAMIHSFICKGPSLVLPRSANIWHSSVSIPHAQQEPDCPHSSNY